MTARHTRTNKGFTLIELLVVIGILAILLAITLIAINPARQFGQANDTNRRSAVTQILNAIGQYTASNGGILPAEITDLRNQTDPDAAVELASSTALEPLCELLVPTYLPALPADPVLEDPDGVELADCQAATPDWETDYFISIDAQNRITVSADDANVYEGPIAVTR